MGLSLDSVSVDSVSLDYVWNNHLNFNECNSWFNQCNSWFNCAIINVVAAFNWQKTLWKYHVINALKSNLAFNLKFQWFHFSHLISVISLESYNNIIQIWNEMNWFEHDDDEKSWYFFGWITLLYNLNLILLFQLTKFCCEIHWCNILIHIKMQIVLSIFIFIFFCSFFSKNGSLLWLLLTNMFLVHEFFNKTKLKQS